MFHTEPDDPVKPCPFCGCRRMILFGSGAVWRVRCTHCESEGPEGEIPLDAIESWNARAVTQPQHKHTNN